MTTPNDTMTIQERIARIRELKAEMKAETDPLRVAAILREVLAVLEPITVATSAFNEPNH